MPPAADLAVAVAFVACGAAALAYKRAPGFTGLLLLATGAAWAAGSISDDLALLHRGPLIHLLVTMPDGRPRTWVQRIVVAAGYVDAIVPAFGQDATVTVSLAGAVSAVAVARALLAGGRARVIGAGASTAIGSLLVAGVIGDTASGEALLWCYEAVLAITAVAVYSDMRWPRVMDLVIDLGDLPRRGSLTSALARASGDPSLVVGYRLPRGGYADERGEPIELPRPGAGRTVTAVDSDGAAVIVHDPVALRAPGLADDVTAVARLALDNQRLEADIRARVRDVTTSRARLLRARDSERRKLDLRLRAGVGRRLDVAAHALGADPEGLLPEMARARAELSRLAAGLHPHDLERGGLPVAVPALAADAPLPVDVSVACTRLDEAVEVTAWFVCSEGLANVVKHAGATRAAITIEHAPNALLVTVDDDGRGAAQPPRALAARVDAAGGRVDVSERPTGGTRLQATLPVAS